jgi:rSAM/selenodomain-associated transferase 2
MHQQNPSKSSLPPTGTNTPQYRGQVQNCDSGAISVIIPTLNAAHSLPTTLHVLTSEKPSGLSLQIVISDGGSTDTTQSVAADHGCDFITAHKGRGQQLAAGARHARHEWLLFLHADTVLERGWDSAIAAFIMHPESPDNAAVFQFRLNDQSNAAHRLERLVHWRNRFLALPYGDQGLLIHRQLYDEIGGFREIPLMEDVDIIRRLGRYRLICFDVAAITDAQRYLVAGYSLRALRNAVCLLLYFLGLPPRLIKRLYD